MACTSCNETTNICGCNQTNSVCFTYQGADLDCIGVPCGVSLEAVLAAINQKICEIRESIINIDGGENYTLNLNVNELQILKDGITNSVVDLSKYLDNINLESLSVDNNTGILTATLTDSSTRTVDLSNLFTDTVITSFTNSRNGNDVTLTINDTGGSTYSTTFTDNSGSGGGVQSVNSGTNVNVDNTDPLNPIVNSTDTNTTNTSLTVTGTDTKTITLTDSEGSTVQGSFTDDSGIQSIVEGTNVTVDNSDPDNPIINSTDTIVDVTSINFTGTTTKTLTLNQSNGNNLTATFTDDSGGGGSTNLTYTATETQGVVESSTGSNATIPSASNLAGLMPGNFNVLNSFTNPNQFTNDSGTIVLTNSTGASRVQFFRTGIHTTLIFFDIDLSFSGGTTVDKIRTDIGSYGGSLGTLSTLNILARTGGVITQFDNSTGTIVSDLICYVTQTSLIIERIDGATITVPDTGLTLSLNVTFPNNF